MMDSMVPSSGKRTGRRKKRCKTRRERKRERKAKSTACEEPNSEIMPFSPDDFDVAVNRPNVIETDRGSRQVTSQTKTSLKQRLSSSVGDTRLSDSGEDFSRASRSETERLTELITAIFEAAADEDDKVTGVSRSGDENRHRMMSSEDSDELLGLADKFNESLRWRYCCSNAEDEKRRMKKYKMNRRKRYLVESLRNRQDKESVLTFAKELATEADSAYD